RMVLVKLDRRVAMPEIMEAIALQTCEDTDASMELVEPGGRQRVSLRPTEYHWGDGRHSLEDGSIKTPVSELQDRGSEFLGHIDTATTAVLRGVKGPVDRIIGPLDMQKPVGIIGVLPKLDILPV